MVVAMKIVDSTLESRFLKSAFCHLHHPLTLIDSEDDYCIQCRLLKCQSLSTTAPFRTMLGRAITFYPLMTCTTFDTPKGSGNMGSSSYQRNSSKVDNLFRFIYNIILVLILVLLVKKNCNQNLMSWS